MLSQLVISDYTLSPKPMITYRAIGGRLDFLVFMGPEPEEVTRQYHQVGPIVSFYVFQVSLFSYKLYHIIMKECIDCVTLKIVYIFLFPHLMLITCPFLHLAIYRSIQRNFQNTQVFADILSNNKLFITLFHFFFVLTS